MSWSSRAPTRRPKRPQVTLPARAVFVLLVGATFAAFFVAQRLKSSPPVAKIRAISHQFSPNGDHLRDKARIRIRVRRDDDVTISIVDAAGAEVKRLVAGMPAQRDRRVRVVWDGTTDAGARARDGIYRVRVSLRRAGRAATLEPGLRLDTVAPRPTLFAGGPDGTRWITGPVAGPVPFHVRVVSPRFRTLMRVLRTDQGAPREVAAFSLAPRVRDGTWDGTVAGAPAPPGTYLLVAAVRDRAHNVGTSAPLPPAPGEVRGQPGVSVRALLAQPPADPVRAGGPVEFAVDSRGRPYRWAIRRLGEARPRSKGKRKSGGALSLRAPKGPSGVYLLDLFAGKDTTTVPFAVQAPTASPLLVVLPAITWFGRDALDDDRDGLPNTLGGGGPAGYPRLLANGLPQDFSSQVAPLLKFLDRQKLRYDLTTDLTLGVQRSGLSSEREGVLLAGPMRWISTPLGQRLRRYVTGGGRLASFGAGTLRRGVGIGRSRLVRPTQPTDTDPFGTRLRPQRRLAGDLGALQPLADEGATGLLTGVETLPGFSEVEESDPSGRVQAAVGAVDTQAQQDAEAAGEQLPESYPALALTQVGKGIVIRVGLPQWGARLTARVTQAQQLTRNIVDILRGATPQIRSF
jgi:hypothetical protein